jgi:hypothetical protein
MKPATDQIAEHAQVGWGVIVENAEKAALATATGAQHVTKVLADTLAPVPSVTAKEAKGFTI